MPNSIYAYAEAAGAAFDARIIGVTPTEERFNQFNGINYGGTNYINLAGNVEFINTVGHEPYHDLARDRPALHKWFVEQARQYYQNFPAYRNKLNALAFPPTAECRYRMAAQSG